LDVDLTGGLGSEPIDIKALRAEAMADAAAKAEAETPADEPAEPVATIKALPTPHVPRQAEVDLDDWQDVTARPEDE
ncbi:hypothetical protein H9X89_16985, partial [Faecalicatena contorta]|nr:hypothetical protein [Faecalicatena contorta]